MIDTKDYSENLAMINFFSDSCDEIMIEDEMFWNNPVSPHLITADYFKYVKNVCPQIFYTLVIYADLQVGVCCVDYKKELIVGDLKETNLFSIWHGEKLHKLRLIHLSGKRNTLKSCKDCTYLYTKVDNLDRLSVVEYENRLKKRS